MTWLYGSTGPVLKPGVYWLPSPYPPGGTAPRLGDCACTTPTTLSNWFAVVGPRQSAAARAKVAVSSAG